MRKTLFALAITTLAGAAFAADLRVGLNPAYEPFESKTPTGEIVGFDVDIANALCEQIKRKCVFVESEWDSIIPGLQAKKYDVIISSMSITPERARVVDFTNRYYKTPSAIVVKKGNYEHIFDIDALRDEWYKTSWLLDKKQSIIAGAITIVILIIVFAGILPKLGNYQDAWASVQAMSWRDKATLVVAMRVPGSPAAT